MCSRSTTHISHSIRYFIIYEFWYKHWQLCIYIQYCYLNQRSRICDYLAARITITVAATPTFWEQQSNFIHTVQFYLAWNGNLCYSSIDTNLELHRYSDVLNLLYDGNIVSFHWFCYCLEIVAILSILLDDSFRWIKYTHDPHYPHSALILFI